MDFLRRGEMNSFREKNRDGVGERRTATVNQWRVSANAFLQMFWHNKQHINLTDDAHTDKHTHKLINGF